MFDDDLLNATATRIFAGQDEALADGDYDRGMWATLVESGLAQAMAGEADGGSRLTAGQAFPVLRALGFAAANVPLGATYLAHWVLGRTTLGVPGWPMTVVLADDRLRLSRRRGGWYLVGEAANVCDARHVTMIVVVGDGEDGPVVGLVDPRDATIHPAHNLAGEARDTVHFDGPLIGRVVPGPAPAEVRAAGAAQRSVQISGATQRVLDMTVRYAQDRVQFGRALGQFQAVQQMIAVMAGQVAAASAAGDLAIDGLDPFDRLLTAAAKVRAGEAAGQIAAIAHQVHGAIGITREHMLGRLTRRLWAWRDEFGNEVEWSRVLGRTLLAEGADALWPMLTAV